MKTLILLLIVVGVGCRGRDYKDREIDGMRLGYEYGFSVAWQHQFDSIKNKKITKAIYDSVYKADLISFEKFINKYQK